MDDLYNNLKVYEAEIKGKSSLSFNSHNVSFVSFENTSSINETINAAHDIPAIGSKEQPSVSRYADDVMFSFSASQSNTLQLDNEDLEQINTDDLEEMDLKCMSEIDKDNNQAKDRYKVGIGYHAVPPPYTRNYMLPKADLSFVGLDNYVFKFKKSKTRTSVNENESIASKSSDEIRKEAKTISTMKSAIICLVDNQKFNFSKYIFDNMVKSLEGGVNFYLFPRFLQAFQDKQGAGFSRIIAHLFDTMMVQAPVDIGDTPVETHQTPIVDQLSTSKPQKKQKPRRKQRKRAKVFNDESEDEDHVPTPSSVPLPSGKDSFILNELMVFVPAYKNRRVKPPLEKDSLGAQEDASKQERTIEEIDQNTEIALDDETQERTNDDEMFGVDDLAREEVVIDTTTGEHEEQIIEYVSTAKPVTIAGEVVTTTTVKDSADLTTNVTEDEITVAQALAALKSIKPKVVVQEQREYYNSSCCYNSYNCCLNSKSQRYCFYEQKQSQIPTVSSLKNKGKAKMIELEVPIKKKDQIRIDEKYARKLEAEEQEAARLSRAQQDEEANNSWDNIQAMMDANRLLHERFQARVLAMFLVK
nr:hypothetical protein [Tanacetum cinerariifolium]